MSIAMPSSGWIGPCSACAATISPRLPREQVDGVRGVVPQQVVGPRARLAERVDVPAAEEVGLHVHLLDVELARGDAAVHPLVARIEAPRVADHRDQAGLASGRRRPPPRRRGCRRAGSRPARACRPRGRRSPATRASASACRGSRRRRPAARGSRRGRSSRGRCRTSAPTSCGGRRAARPTSDVTSHAVDLRERFEVLDAEGAGTGEADVQGVHRGTIRDSRG